MKSYLFSFIIVALVVHHAYGSPPKTSNHQWPHYGLEALELTNRIRTEYHKPPVAWHQELAAIATQHSKAMGTHTTSFGHGGFATRMRGIKGWKSCAENVYMCDFQGNIASLAIQAWRLSKGHFKNLIGYFTHCGIGFYKNKEGYWYVTQIFARF